MDNITFADGTTAHCSFLATIPDGTAFIALDGIPFTAAADIFFDTNKTSEMQYGDLTLIGYTQLQGLYSQPYGLQAVLKGGHDERRE